MSEKKKAGLSRLQKMSTYDDLVAMATGDDKGNIAQFEQGFKDKAVELPLSQLHSFPNHPFKVTDDDAMQSLADSIRNRGVLHPIVVRQDSNSGYQIISGHRRKRACEIAGIITIPAYIVDLSDDEAIILMADANFYQREGLLPSEKARAYRMKSDAIKRHQGVRGKNTIEEIGEGTSDSAATVKRFLRLSYLTDNLLDMVDEKKIGQEQAIHISYLNEELQTWIYEILEQSQVSMTGDQAKDLRKVGEEGYLDKPKIWEILMRTVKKKRKYTLKQDVLDRYFAEGTTDDEIEQTIINALDAYMRAEGGEL
jgi:ParB family chromosome partitioning protein